MLLIFSACLAPASGQGKRPPAGIPRRPPDLPGCGRDRVCERTEGTAAARGPRQGGGTGAALAGAPRLLSEGRARAPFLRPPGN